MAEQPVTIKQIQIGENNHDIDAKYWGGVESSYINDLATQDYVDKKIWYGTQSKYDEEKANIGIGTLVIILDENDLGGNPDGSGSGGGDVAGSSTTAKLGTAVLGQMKLGQE